MKTPDYNNEIYDHEEMDLEDAVGLDRERLEYLDKMIDNAMDCQNEDRKKKSEIIEFISNYATKKELAMMLMTARGCPSCRKPELEQPELRIKAMEIRPDGSINEHSEEIPEVVAKAIEELAKRLRGGRK